MNKPGVFDSPIFVVSRWCLQRYGSWLVFGLFCLGLLGCSGGDKVAAGEGLIQVDAGTDQGLALDEAALLDGRQSHLTPLEFWLADGDGPLEDHLVRYHSVEGPSSIGPLRDSVNNVCGWPSDMVWVGERLVGLHSFRRRIVLIAPQAGSVRYFTERLEKYEAMKCLAYDSHNERLLGVDAKLGELFSIDLAAGRTDSLARLNLADVTGLAFDAATSQLYAYDQESKGLYRVDSASGASELVWELPVPEGWICDELTMFNGRMYTAIGHEPDGLGQVQVYHIDLESGHMEKVGPLVEKVVGHTLVMRSVPEQVQWKLVEGPGEVQIEAPFSLTSPVHFKLPGLYTFQLSLNGISQTTDTVTFTVGL